MAIGRHGQARSGRRAARPAASFPPTSRFDREGRALAAAVRPATPRAAARATQSRIWRFALDGVGEPAHARAERRLLCRAIRRSTTGSPSPPTAPSRARPISSSSTTARRRPLGDIPGTVEDLRWTSDGAAIVVLAADRGLDGGATNGAKRLAWGDDGGPRGRQPDGRAAAAVQGRCRRTERRSRSARPISASGSSTCSATTRPSRSSRTTRASAAGITPHLARIDFAIARGDDPASHRDWQLLSPSASPSGKRVAFLEGWSSDRGLVASEISILDIATGKLSTVAAAEASDITTLPVARRREPLVRRLVEARLDLRRRRDRRHSSSGRATKTRSSARTASPRSISPTPDKTGFAAVRETDRRAAGDRLQGTCRARTGRRSRKLNGGGRRRASTTIPRSARFAGRARTACELEGLVLLPQRPASRAAADDRRHPRRPELGGQARLQSRLRAAVRGRRLCGLPAELPRQYRLGPGIRAAEHRRSGRRRVRGHPRRHRPLRRRGHRRSRPARRHRRELRRLHDGLGGGDHRPLQGGGHGLRHRQPAEQPLFLQPRFPRLHQRRAAHARSATATSRSTARRSCASTSRRRRR